ncbi:Papain-like cysteine peptidase superfamily [Forsythia ovata]|uniref:Papain-like cysteine peptidase superfamily n=1 Tax=Forsythia ovata TaxID=205694 RepID=A0ABD1RL38_9LAMI
MEVKDIEPSEIEIDEVYMVGLIHTSPRQPTVVDDDETQHHQFNCLIPSVGVDKFQTRNIRNDDDDFEITLPFHMKTSDVPTSSKQPHRKTNCGHLNEEMMKILADILLKNQELSVELLKMKSQMSAMRQELCRSNEESMKWMSEIVGIQQNISSDVTDTKTKMDSMTESIQQIQKTLNDIGPKQYDCQMETGTIPAASVEITSAAPLKRISKPGRCLLSHYLPNDGSSPGNASKLSDDIIVFKEELAPPDDSDIFTVDDWFNKGYKPHNNHDCGVFVIKYLEYLLYNKLRSMHEPFNTKMARRDLTVQLYKHGKDRRQCKHDKKKAR